MAYQYYVIQPSGVIYQQDLTTKAVQQISQIPPGSAVQTWQSTNGSLPPAIQNAVQSGSVSAPASSSGGTPIAAGNLSGSMAYGAINTPVVLPTIPPAVYNSYATAVASGTITPQVAKQQLQSMIGNTYSGYVDTNQLFPANTPFNGPGGIQVEFGTDGSGQTTRYTPPKTDTTGGTAVTPTTANNLTGQSQVGQQQQQQQQQQQPTTGTTGKTPPPLTGGTPYFLGDHALMYFANGENGQPASTPWLLDRADGTIRPLASQAAVTAIFGDNAQAAIDGALKNVASPTTDNTGKVANGSGFLGGFQVLDPSYVVHDDGSSKLLLATPNQLQDKYGQTTSQPLEGASTEFLDQFLSLLEANPKQSGLDPSFVSTVASNPNELAFYTSALAYGGYTLSDVYKDLKLQTIKGTDPSLSSASVISPSMKAADYAKTPEGQQAASLPAVQMPAAFGQLESMNQSGLKLFSTPDSLYKTPAQFIGIDGNTQPLGPVEGMSQSDVGNAMSAVSQITAAYYDVVQQKLQASTEQENAVANYNWDQLKNYTQTNLGIQLSDDALQAWNQISGIENQYATQGIEGSGMQQESMDQYLKTIRTNDQVVRNQAATTEQNAKYAYYTQYATPDQIKALAQTNPQLAQELGLIPSAATTAALTPQALMAKYPGMTDAQVSAAQATYVSQHPNASQAEIDAYITQLKEQNPGLTEAQANQYISTVLDQNGNYRSNLYNNYMSTQLANTQDEYSNIQKAADTKSATAIDQWMSQYDTQDASGTSTQFMSASPNAAPLTNSGTGQTQSTSGTGTGNITTYNPPGVANSSMNGVSGSNNLPTTNNQTGGYGSTNPAATGSGSGNTGNTGNTSGSGNTGSNVITPKVATQVTAPTNSNSQYNFGSSGYSPAVSSGTSFTGTNQSSSSNLLGQTMSSSNPFYTPSNSSSSSSPLSTGMNPMSSYNNNDTAGKIAMGVITGQPGGSSASTVGSGSGNQSSGGGSLGSAWDSLTKGISSLFKW